MAERVIRDLAKNLLDAPGGLGLHGAPPRRTVSLALVRLVG
jgi:hypothetical protein